MRSPRHPHDRRAFPFALIAVATAAATAACGSSGGNPAPPATHGAPSQPKGTRALSTTRPAAPQKFTSQRYRFRVTLTEAWSGDDALVAWNGKKLQGLGSTAFANFTDPPTGRTLVVGAARGATGEQLAEWRAAMVRAAPAVCADSSSVEHTTIGGEPALAWAATCSDGYDVNKLAALHGRRGYMILLASPTANDNAADRDIFESTRRSFRFTR
jgi:hypothetical protein